MNDYNSYDKGYGQQGYGQQGYGYGQPQYGYQQQSAAQVQNEHALASYVATVMQKVYVKMGLGLLLTAIVAFVVAGSGWVLRTHGSSMEILPFWVM